MVTYCSFKIVSNEQTFYERILELRIVRSDIATVSKSKTIISHLSAIEMWRSSCVRSWARARARWARPRWRPTSRTWSARRSWRRSWRRRCVPRRGGADSGSGSARWPLPVCAGQGGGERGHAGERGGGGGVAAAGVPRALAARGAGAAGHRRGVPRRARRRGALGRRGHDGHRAGGRAAAQRRPRRLQLRLHHDPVTASLPRPPLLCS